MKSKAKKMLVLLIGIAMFYVILSIKSSVYAVEQIEITTVHIDDIPDQYYKDGDLVTPSINVTTHIGEDDVILEESDYNVVYTNSRNVTQTAYATVVLNPSGKYTTSGLEGGVKIFKILPKSLQSEGVTIEVENQVYNDGNPLTPDVTITSGNRILTSDDFDIEYSNNINVGLAQITITGKGNYNNSKSTNFFIGQKSIETAEITIEDQTYYKGDAISPRAEVRFGDKVLEFSTEYSISGYSSNTNTGVATANITGNGNYTGVRSVNFNIIKANLTPIITVISPNIVYTGSQIRPDITVSVNYNDGQGNYILNASTDYDVEYGENINAGDGTITVTLKGNYEGENSFTFDILGAQLPIDKVKIDNNSVENVLQNTPLFEREYTGDAIIPTIEIEGLILNEDYTVNISNNTYPSESNALIEIRGIGNYDGRIRRTFKIVKASVTPQIELISETEEYTGEEILPRINVKVNGENYDYYNIEYLDSNINPGICRFKVILNGAIYEGKNESSFEIVPLNVSQQALQIRLKSNEFVYNASAIEPEIEKVLVTITDNRNNTKTVELNSSDYEITGDEEYINVGTGRVNIRLKGNYIGENYAEFNIKPKEVTPQIKLDVTETIYSKEQIKPTVVSVRRENAQNGNVEEIAEIKEGYTVEYGENINAGKGTVTVTLKGNYKGTVTKEFDINQADLPENKITVDLSDKLYDGKEQKPEVKIEGLVNGKDFKVSYKDNKSVGTATITIEGIGNYKKTITRTFKIKQSNVPENKITVDLTDKSYTGKEIKPQVKIDGLKEGIDFDVEYKDNINVGTAAVIIKGKGNYNGTTTKNLKITKAKVTPTIEKIANQEYTGAQIKPNVVVKINGVITKDYTVVYGENKNVGNGTVKVSLKGNYTGDSESSFVIVSKKVTPIITTTIPNQTYTGKQITPNIEVKTNINNKEIQLNKNDYDVTYSNNTNIGKATIKVKLKNNYSGETTKTFNIISDIAKSSTELLKNNINSVSSQQVKITKVTPTIDTISNQTYTGAQIKPNITVKINGVVTKNYTVQYGQNKEIGQGTVKVILNGNYVGENTAKFNIVSKTVKFSISKINDVVYNGKEQKPTVKFTVDNGKTKLTEKDYDIIYSNNINAGEAKVTVKAKGNYTGQQTTKFKIVAKKLPTVTFDTKDKKYTGGEIKPKVKINGLKENTDYKVTYTNNKKIGTAKIVVNGINNYTGQQSAKFKIVIGSLPEPTIDLSDKVYTGKEIKPKVKINGLKENTDYTVKYKNNKEIGTATIKITGIGNFKGSCTKNFDIVPQKVTGTKITKKTKDSLTISWKKTPGDVSGYKIYLWNDAKQEYDFYGKVKKDTSFTLKPLKNNKIFKMKVKAYKTVKGKQYLGERSDPFKGRTLK